MAGKPNRFGYKLKAGLTIQQLADKAGFHRLAVGYWENKHGKFSARCGAPQAFVEALDLKYFHTPIRTHAGWSITECVNERIEREVARPGLLLALR